MNYNLGRVGIVMHDVYDEDKTYEALDMVPYEGSGYIAKGSTTGNPPTDTDYWILAAQRGAQGDQGDKGDKGNQGEKGEPGQITGTVSKAQGGLGADVSTQEALVQALGIRRGSGSVSISPGGSVQGVISFSPAFSSVPASVQATVCYTGGSNLAGVYTSEYTASSFRYTVIRGGSGGGSAITIPFTWVAIQ